MLEAIREARHEEGKEKLIEGAWIGFQMGAGGKQNFGEYLRSMGLMEAKPSEGIPGATGMTAKEAIEIAERIIKAARKK